MSSLTDYNLLQVVTPDPSGAGGLAINNNFKKLSDRFAYLSTSDPGVDDDSSAGFSVGSRWYNTATSTEWICVDNTTASAVWDNVFDQSLNTTDSPTFAGLSVASAGNIGMAGGALTGVGSISSDGGLFTSDGSGNVTAASFSGDGSGLTGVIASPAGSAGAVQYNNSGVAGGFGSYGPDANSVTSLQLLGSSFDSNDGSGTGGGVLNLDSPTIYAGSQSAGAGSGGSAKIYLQGASLFLNDGSGVGGTIIEMDGSDLQGVGSLHPAGGQYDIDATTGLASFNGVIIGNVATLDIYGNATFPGTVSGATFSGSGGGLTGVPAPSFSAVLALKQANSPSA